MYELCFTEQVKTLEQLYIKQGRQDVQLTCIFSKNEMKKSKNYTTANGGKWTGFLK